MIEKFIKILHRMKVWVENFASKPYSLHALFWIAFIEASFFPIPPDVLLIALAVEAPKRSFKFALICTLGSVTGAYLGYLIGYSFFEIIGKPILNFYGILEKFEAVLSLYQQNGFWALFVAGFTPIPYKVFTIAAGFNQTIDLWTLTIGSFIGRASRFFLVGGLLYIFGPQIKSFIDKYFDKLSIAFVVLLVLGFIAIKWII
ncbi:MAG: lipoprotein B [Ignavibacteriae bacterium]|nr:MAG: lipoprotein B [Ignavibacteriota bacterium]